MGHENQAVLRVTDSTDATSCEEDKNCGTARVPTSNVVCGLTHTSFQCKYQVIKLLGLLISYQ